MKIHILTACFYPELHPRAFRAFELARELVRQGDEVHVSILTKVKGVDYQAMQQLGFGYERLMEMGLASPVTGISCEYIQPARYPDVLDIQILLREYDSVRFCFAYEVRRQTDHALLCRGETKHCLIGKAGLPVRIRTHYPEIHALMLRWLEESAQSAASVQ